MLSNRKFRHSLFLLALGALSPIQAQDVLPDSGAVPFEAMTEAYRSDLVRRISEIANDVANRDSFFETDMRPININVSFDTKKNVVVFDFEERFGSEAGWTEMNDLQQSITEQVKGVTPLLDYGKYQLWLYGGKDIDFWLPTPDRGRKSHVEPRRKIRSLFLPEKSRLVLVAAGHGLYYHHGFKKWTAHRERVNGVLEDETTEQLAGYLMTYLGEANVHFESARSRSGLEDFESKQPSRTLGARYNLKKIVPDHPEIWNVLADDKDPGRERREDIRSRPLYANHINASAVVHIHTNAAKLVTARGAQVYVFPGRPEDRKLANAVLCSLRDVIHSVELFKNFPVDSELRESPSHAENKLSDVPSIIVETAFHTNVEDAKLLLDPAFKRAAMKGVAKGYRLYQEGKDCATFAIDSVATNGATMYQALYASFELTGNPHFPLDLRYTRADCDQCIARHEYISKSADLSKIRLNYMCKSSDVDAVPMKFQAIATDVYGVATKPKSFEFSCKRSS